MDHQLVLFYIQIINKLPTKSIIHNYTRIEFPNQIWNLNGSDIFSDAGMVTRLSDQNIVASCHGIQRPDCTYKLIQSSPAHIICLLYTSPSPRDGLLSRMPS